MAAMTAMQAIHTGELHLTGDPETKMAAMTAMQAIHTGELHLTGDPETDIARMEAWDRGDDGPENDTDRIIAESDALERAPMVVHVEEERGPTIVRADDGSVAMTHDEDGPVSKTVPHVEPGKVVAPEEKAMEIEERIVEAPPAAAEVVDQLALDAEVAGEAIAAGPVIVDGVVMGTSAVVGTHKEVHSRLILNGVCSNCANCGMKLTDATSIERGIGPTCSRRGYEDVEPVDPDEMQAFIALAEYPTLCEHLAEHWKPKGIRGLMNGLVRVCSLNRKNPVHTACTKAIELLGYKQLAATLRESLAVVSISTLETEVNGVKTTEVSVWVRRSEYNGEYGRQIREIFGAHWVSNKGSRNGKRGKLLIPVARQQPGDEPKRVGTFIRHRPEEGQAFGAKRVFWAPDAVGGQPIQWMSNKALIWHLLCQHFEGLICKTDQGGVYIHPVVPKA